MALLACLTGGLSVQESELALPLRAVSLVTFHAGDLLAGECLSQLGQENVKMIVQRAVLGDVLVTLGALCIGIRPRRYSRLGVIALPVDDQVSCPLLQSLNATEQARAAMAFNAVYPSRAVRRGQVNGRHLLGTLEERGFGLRMAGGTKGVVVFQVKSVQCTSCARQNQKQNDNDGKGRESTGW
jgi:hypothetical protein